MALLTLGLLILHRRPKDGKAKRRLIIDLG